MSTGVTYLHLSVCFLETEERKETEMNKLKMMVSLEGINTGESADKPTPVQVSANVIKNIMFSYAQGMRGLTGEERKQYYRISAALDEAVKNNAEVVEIEDQDAGFLKKCRREARMLPSDILQRVEENIDAMVRV